MSTSQVRLLRWSFLALLFSLAATPGLARPLLVLADASLQDALPAIAAAWEAQGLERPSLRYGGSAELARQVEALAPADLLVSADPAPMNAVAQRGLLRPGSMADLIGNRIVLVAPGGGEGLFGPVDPLLPVGPGQLAMSPEPYGEAALRNLHLWPSIAGRITLAPHSRAALDLVARRKVSLGVVYLTDARSSPRVHVVGIFPRTSHSPIRYTLAIPVTSSNPQSERFRRYLLSPQSRATFLRFGFTMPAR